MVTAEERHTDGRLAFLFREGIRDLSADLHGYICIVSNMGVDVEDEALRERIYDASNSLAAIADYVGKAFDEGKYNRPVKQEK